MGAIVVGMLLFFGDQLTTRGLIGNFLAMASAVTMAWMTLFLRRERSGSAETILLGNTLTAVIGVPFLFAATVTPVDWGILLFMGIFQLGIPFILYSVAIQQLEAVETILISTLEPILNPIWVFMVVGERPGPMAMLGGLIVVGAVTVRALIASGFGQSREVPVPVQTGD
jgi:drug/metabolite transporter (DMT)-like permease